MWHIAKIDGIIIDSYENETKKTDSCLQIKSFHEKKMKQKTKKHFLFLTIALICWFSKVSWKYVDCLLFQKFRSIFEIFEQRHRSDGIRILDIQQIHLAIRT